MDGRAAGVARQDRRKAVQLGRHGDRIMDVMKMVEVV